MAFVYVFKTESIPPFFKVGYTKGNVDQRLKSVQVGCPYQINEYARIRCDNGPKLETEIHERLNEYHARGEWFEAPIAKVNAILDEYCADGSSGFVEITLAKGNKCLVRLLDNEIFVPLNTFSGLQAMAYFATGDLVLNSDQSQVFISLADIEKDYPELSEDCMRFRKKIFWQNVDSCGKCQAGDISIKAKGDFSAMMQCLSCGHGWFVSLL